MTRTVMLPVAIAAALFMAFLSMPAVADDPDGKGIFLATCGNCHQLPEPDMLKPAQWERVTDVMMKRMEQKGMEPLAPDELAAVKEYLKSLSGGEE